MLRSGQHISVLCPKMVLLHGLFLNSDCWHEQLPTFDSEFSILRYDLRGHGRTTKPKKRFTIRNYVDDLYALLNHYTILSEEKYCSEKYGESYLKYTQNVPRYFLFF